MTPEEKVRRLREMLGQFARDSKAPLEELVSDSEGLEASPPPRPPENLVKLARDEPLTTDDIDGLEAIILPVKRPVALIQRGRYGDVGGPWTHLNASVVRQRIEPSLPSIGRIELPNNPLLPYGGTGFIVASDLVMTNRHVAAIFTEGVGTKQLVFRSGSAAIDFEREQPIEGSDATTLLLVRDVAMIHPYWDMALLRVDGIPVDRKPLRLAITPPEDLEGTDIAVIGYPARDARNALTVQDRVFENRYFVKRFQPGKIRQRARITSFESVVNAMVHDASTLGGNSGSAVISVDTGEAVALHFAGVYLKANYAVPMYELARDPHVVALGLNFMGSVTPSDQTSVHWSRVEGANPRAARIVEPPLANTTHASAAAPAPVSAASPSNANTAITFTIPLQISITMGSPTLSPVLGTATSTAPAAALATSTATVDEAPKFAVPVIHPDLERRRGYQPDFLGTPVPLPSLTTRGANVAAKLANGSHVLHYHRFSIVMYAQRRLALFTAANVDWRTERRLVAGKKPSRRELTGLAEGQNERWVPDSRIPAIAQLPDEFFTRDGGAFDKGHLVRRDDVAWGDSFDDIQRGNGDTYHTTNCTPQTAQFNRSGAGDDNWGDLENLVQSQTKKQRALVFSGPVLDPDDKYFRGVDDAERVSVQIPSRFWKIIVVEGRDGLEAYGFVLEQALADVALHEEFSVPPSWRRYLTSIDKIEELLFGLARLDALAAIDASRTAAGQRIAEGLTPSGGEPRIDSMCLHEIGGGNEEGLESTGPARVIPVLIGVRDAEWKPPDGVEVVTRLGTIISAHVTADGLTALSHDRDGVRRVDISRQAGEKNCDASIPFSLGDRGRFPSLIPPNGVLEDGSGALVGIVDNGIDVLHECFRDSSGTSRIIAIWDQKEYAGPSPKSADPRFTQNYGTYYGADAIAGFLKAQSSPERIGGLAAHGTLVASVAAGRACGSFAGGMAPAAKIAVVIPKLDINPGDPRSIGYSNAHVDAFGFLDAVAEQHDLPIVVNVSLGMNAGAHDGKSLLENGFDEFTRNGRCAGRAIVKAAGNEFGKSGHAYVEPFEGFQTISWTSGAGLRFRDYFEAWFPPSMDLEFRVVAPNGLGTPFVSRRAPAFQKHDIGGNLCTLDYCRSHQDNGDSRLVISIERGSIAIMTGTWTLEIIGRDVTDIDRLGLHMWVERDDARAITFASTAGAVNDLTLSIPGTAHTVITVGACSKQNPVRLADFSSRGPTRDRRNKPDIAAPGIDIVGAGPGTENGVQTDSGTSFAAPHVTGAIALLFSRQKRFGKPLSNADQIRKAIAAHSRRNQRWNPGLGYGLLDVLSFLNAFE